jgi:hypothetical protein
MESGYRLEMLARKHLTITGEYAVSKERNSILLPKFKAYNSEGKAVKKVKAQDVVKIMAQNEVSSKDRVVIIRPNAMLYAYGQCHGMTFLDSEDPATIPATTFYAEQDLDLSTLEHGFKLYVTERGVSYGI